MLRSTPSHVSSGNMTAYSPQAILRVTPPLTVTLASTADAQVSSGRPTESHGSADYMFVGLDDATFRHGLHRSLVRSDLSGISAGGVVSSAKLRLGVRGAGRTPEPYCPSDMVATTYRIQTDWSEAEVTWNNSPQVGESFGSVTIPFAYNKDPWVVFDVVDLVQGWVNGTWPNLDIMLKTQEPVPDRCLTHWRAFWTREAAKDRPELLVAVVGEAGSRPVMSTPE